MTKTKLALGIFGSAAALGLTATPAFAAGSFTQPSTNPATISQLSDGSLPSITITATGLPAYTLVEPEVCDGVSPASKQFSVTIDCDLQTSPAQKRTDANGNVTFPVGAFGVGFFPLHGNSPNDLFNCVAPDDALAVNQTTGQATLAPNKTQTTDGNQPLDPGVNSWTNCQIRLSSNDSAPTSDQIFTVYNIANGTSTPPSSVPESPLAIALPAGAVVLLAGGALVVRSRRRHAN